ncbi:MULTISPECIES: triacylglycerol lipase [Pseudomonas]|uniref:esterase/lipase family protein n=1 Tax=Pseudomonas TaxID=286 RepID=UPI00218C1756|nr:alpha/beta hydrolase [Pseudomonas sp. LRP2-20]BDM22734.1 membrane protein [Pseudomonas sp. LRP2-20]
MIDPLKLYTVVNSDGTRTASSTMSSSAHQQEKEIGVKANRVVPIVFIPGIMGTNLWNNRTKKIAWIAPNTDTILSSVAAIGSFLSSLFSSAKDRQNDLDGRPGMVTVYNDGPIGGSGLKEDISKDELKRRGWGGIMRSAYHPIMESIQNEMNSVLLDNNLQGWWRDHADHSPAEWGDWNDNPPLSKLPDEQGLKHVAEIRYEVWAGGYNWLQSNDDSATDIINFIENSVLPSYESAEKVIIVTHSMGGLVARAMVGRHNCEQIYGVIHGAMPATGAPAAYRRIRAGFEGEGAAGFVARQILGPTASETTAVLAFSRGGLELLPSKQYDNESPWLFARKTNAPSENLIALPKSGDPYNDIYLSKKWWGLVPEENEKLIDPNQFIETKSKGDWGGTPTKRQVFESNVRAVRGFHDSIKKAYHPYTYVHYSGEAKELELLTWRDITWQSDWIGWGDINEFKITKDDSTGTVELDAGYKFTFAPKYSPGDGTVPLCSSASSRDFPTTRAAFAHGNNSTLNPTACRQGIYNNSTGYEHQSSYNDTKGRSLFATLYSIARVSQHVKL